MSSASASDIADTAILGAIPLVRKPSDWTWECRSNHLRHVPTNTVFEIFIRHDLRTGDLATPDDLRARLVQAQDGITPLSDAGCEVLCGEAVVMAGFRPSKPYRSRLVWRDLDGNTQSKLLLGAPETVLAIAVKGEPPPSSSENAPDTPMARPARGSGRRRSRPNATALRPTQ
jgi:hypothetical protein